MKRETSSKTLASAPASEKSVFDQDQASADAQAACWRSEAQLDGPPTGYEVKLATALRHMVEWTKAAKFKPRNEEDVQCFLYHSLVLQFDDATRIRTKRTIGTPSVKVGDTKVGGMHFPDLIIGVNDRDAEAIYIEIKVRARGRKASHQACLADVAKLAKNHPDRRQFFILFDCDEKVVYLSEAQKTELMAAATKGCTVWHYPEGLNNSPGKDTAKKAIETMKRNGVDLKALAKENAKKAVKTKRAKAAKQLEASAASTKDARP